jgi:hypothetical protein
MRFYAALRGIARHRAAFAALCRYHIAAAQF